MTRNEPVQECAQCRRDIKPGSWAIEFESDYFCNEGCLSERVLDLTEYEEVQI